MKGFWFTNWKSEIPPGTEVHKFTGYFERGHSALKERLFEEVRQEVAPSKPSRIGSVFIVGTYKDALKWIGDWPYTWRLFEVSYTGVTHRADAAYWNNAGRTEPEIREAAEQYWKGSVGGAYPEILVKGPVTVVAEVDRYEDRHRRRRTLKELSTKSAARYKDKKTVENKDGEKVTVYEYSEKQVQHRNREKAERVEKLRGNLHKLQAQVKKDLKSEDTHTRLCALAVGLMNDTYERVGNDESAKDGHVGVTGWMPEHIKFGDGKATITYVGKSGVEQEKVTKDADLIRVMKEAVKDKKKGDTLFSYEGGKVDASAVNEYLDKLDLGITAKDIRGLHANREMQDRLKSVRSKGGKLPEDKKDREKKLKDEFKEALEGAAEAVGHEPNTLKSQYLVPGLEDAYLKDGTVLTKLDEKKASQRLAMRYMLAADPVTLRVMCNEEGAESVQKVLDFYQWCGEVGHSATLKDTNGSSVDPKSPGGFDGDGSARIYTIERVASRSLEAGLRDWLTWMVRPFQVILKHHKEFVQGPVDDAVDAIIKDLAPKLVLSLRNQEVDEAVDEFVKGATQGREDALGGRPSRPQTMDQEGEKIGYVWGFLHAKDWDGRDLPPYMRKQVVQSAFVRFSKRITEEVVLNLMEKTWHAINPVNTVKAILVAVKKHGWKLGVGFALFELFEHFVLPAILVAVTGNKNMLALASVPVGEVIYAVIFRIMGRAPKEVDKADERGHLDWYESQYGPLRLASVGYPVPLVCTASGEYQLMDLSHDRFVHFTPRSRADQILASGKLLMHPPYKKFGIDAVTAVSTVWGKFVPGVQTRHTQLEPGDEMVAVVFQTTTMPEYGYREEVVWNRDVTLKNPKVLSFDQGKALLGKARMVSEDTQVLYAVPSWCSEVRERQAKKTPAQKEDKDVRQMLKPDPKKKPPREDLRRNRMRTQDKDLEGGGADGDKDLSLNYKKVAERLVRRWLLATDDEHKPGDVWKTEDGKWVAKNPDGNVHTFGDAEGAKDRAKAYAQGKGGVPENERAQPKPKPPSKGTVRSLVKENRAQLEKRIQDIVGGLPKDTAENLKALFGSTEDTASKTAFLDQIASALDAIEESVVSDLASKGVTKDMMSKAHKDPFGKVDWDDPHSVAKALVQKNVNDKVLLNPAYVGGKSLSTESLDEAALVSRAMDALDQYRKGTTEARKTAAENAVSLLDGMDPDSPQAKELNRIIDGIQLAMEMNGEKWDATDSQRRLVREPLDEKMAMLASQMVAQGQAHLLLSDGSDQKAVRESVRDALGRLSDGELSELAKDTPWQPIGELLGGVGGVMLDPQVSELLRGLLRDMSMNNMTLNQGLVNAVAGKKMPASNPLEVYEAVRKKFSAKVSDEMGSEASSFIDCLLESEDAGSCSTDAGGLPKKHLEAMSKALDSVMKEMGVEVDPANPIIAKIRHAVETGDTSILDENVRPEKPIEEQKKDFLEGVEDLEERERIQKMSPEEFREFLASIF